MKTLETQRFKNEIVIIRVDFNVPLDEDGQVTDATRIVAAKPTINWIRSRGGSCVLLSHLGRPKGETPALSLSQIVPKVSEILEAPSNFVRNLLGKKPKRQQQL